MLHIGWPAGLASGGYTGRISDAVQDGGLLYLVAGCILDSFAGILGFLSFVLASLLLVLRLIEFKALFADGKQAQIP